MFRVDCRSMTKPSEPWIATPHLRPDYRGPVGRAYVPFRDPALSAPMIATLEGLATKSADAIAIDAPGEALSYRSLWQAVCRLRSQIESIAETNASIAILLPIGAAYVVAVFAVLASRRIGLLLDQRFPDDRNAAIAAVAGVDVVLAASELGDAWVWRNVATVNSAAAFDQAVAAVAPRDALALDEPAFILCTSGSTGLPKAIVHSQRTMLHWARTVADAMHLTPEDRVLSVSSPSNLGGFVALLACALTGASMQMLDVASLGLGALINVLETRPVTILRAAPSFLRSLARVPGAAAAMARLRLLQLFGEPLWKADLAELRRILPAGCLIRSTYGSTEASGLSWFAGDPDDYDPLRVATGILMPDTTALVVADDGHPCPPGEAGELVIRSKYNALGEWREGRILGGMFEPAAPDDSSRTYRTGDIARFHPDGVFVVLGRKDRMLKINGQRVEPGEVEAALRRSPEVAEAAVLPYDLAGATRLVAFAIPAANAGPDLANRLKADLQSVLPRFMTPSRILLLSGMPRLPGGKVDAQRLLALADESASSGLARFSVLDERSD